MCGIVGAIAQRDVSQILVEGLKRLEYRGYDSAGLAIYNNHQIQRLRRLGKVSELDQALKETPLPGGLGIAHTRWATHGEPSERNAHPHMSENNIALVHNGIIENHDELRDELKAKGYVFTSDTDTEVMAHCLHEELKTSSNLLEALQKTTKKLQGAYGTVAIDANDPDKMVVARSGSPLVIGKGIGEYFVASDQLALLPVTRDFIYLEEGEVAEVRRDGVTILDSDGKEVEREFETSDIQHDAVDKGRYRHFMLKEIFEQPQVVNDTLEGRLVNHKIIIETLGANANKVFADTQAVQIIACGTSYHAAMVAKYWIEDYLQIPCLVEIASEYRYRETAVLPNSLFVTISQSGETADTLAALKKAKEQGYLGTLTVCNSPASSMVRESDFTLLTRAGTEIGVASTKAFTAQLVSLMLLMVSIGKAKGLDESKEKAIAEALEHLPNEIQAVLEQAEAIEDLSEQFAEKHHTLFLGRGQQYPIAMEAALKLKEISYIHAEAYAAGELKHGPLALIDKEMPIVVVAPKDNLLEKLKSNIEEVRSRGGQLFVFADESANIQSSDGITVFPIKSQYAITAPMVYTIPMQLLSYYVAVIKGTDVDQPRNLAKSVTVE
ncbi:glutamine--fructose-6-phosphate transaminase (isomerizing) [Kangiella sp.]|uniref:glutamine--fructose-6-phosphate transaminase (isomerizing) n=1 Tax=Kangiella sp. TaxID=1920245 RepID=UPI0019BC0B22|nr:glutamine--fructose-6-phosphate transaminase (isomerizing) [Kangiella sp.]MBD3654231.1 glutamine--fructose-6-phosphate transaminase (isomerizing) [Kangiella sp.]